MKKIIKLILMISFISFSVISCTFDKSIDNKENNQKQNIDNKDGNQEQSVEKATINEISDIPTVEEIINYMCSEEIMDREKGTEGNKKVTKYLSNIFTDLKLDYIYDSSYLNKFKYEEFENSFIEANNVVGKIKGKENKKAMILTAHFDAWYNGALDNASGVASLIEITKNLKNYSNTNELDYDIIFCLTNLEMNLFAGSKAFVEDISQKYESIVNINIDCIGALDVGAMAIKNLSNIKESADLYSSLKNIYDEMGIEYIDDFSTNKTKQAFEQGSGVSDYISFERKNIPNMQVAQYGISNLILNENDKPNILDFQMIARVSDALTEFVKRYKL